MSSELSRTEFAEFLAGTTTEPDGRVLAVMLGLAGIALALILGIGVRRWWCAGRVAIRRPTYAGNTWGLGKTWAKLPFVARNRWLI